MKGNRHLCDPRLMGHSCNDERDRPFCHKWLVDWYRMGVADSLLFCALVNLHDNGVCKVRNSFGTKAIQKRDSLLQERTSSAKIFLKKIRDQKGDDIFIFE